MNEQCRTWVAMAAMVATLGVSHGAWAEEGEAPAPQAVKTEFTWVASEAGKPVGVERMKGVISPTKKRFVSIEVVPDKERKADRVTSVHWRDADGTLRKYSRKVQVRLGKELRAFRRGVGIRIVGKNQKLEPVEIPKASEHHVWDPQMLSGLAMWLELGNPNGETSFKVIDMGQRASVTARLVPVEAATVGDPSGQAATLRCWKAWAGGAEVATICDDGAGVLVSVEAGRRTLLMKDWTWTVPEVLPTPKTDAEGAPATEKGEAVEEPGVGP